MKAMKKSVSAAVGTLLIGAASASVGANPFGYAELPGGYQQAQQQQQEMRCGGDKATKKDKPKHHEGKCGEGKCGEGKCGEDKAKAEAEAKAKMKDKQQEGKCGEGKCGEGKCGAA